MKYEILFYQYKHFYIWLYIWLTWDSSKASDCIYVLLLLLLLMMMMLLAVFIINSVHVNSHHVSSRTVEWRLCCRNIFVQFWRVHEVNFDDVKTEKNACHRTNRCHIHNVSSAVALKRIKHEMKRRSAVKLGSGVSVEDDWCSMLLHLFLAAEAMTDDDDADTLSLFLCHCTGLLHFTI